MRHRTRSTRHSARKARRKLFSTIIIIIFLTFATLNWILPNLIGGVGVARNVLQPVKEINNPTSVSVVLAPPVLFVPYEATNSAKIDIRGYATAHAKVKIYLEDELKDTVDVGADGNLTAKGLQLALGKNNIYGKTVDEKNSESQPSKTIVLIYDNEAPSLSVAEPEDGKVITGDKKVAVVGKTEPDTPVLINNSRVITDSDGSFKTTIQLNDGDNTVTIKAVDNASNSTEIVRKVTVQP